MSGLGLGLVVAAALAAQASNTEILQQSSKPSQRAPRAPAWLRPAADRPPPVSPRRIVSFAPVVTETAFRLGRGDRLVGATRFCDRPAEALRLPRVGGYVDISLERVLALEPDLVIAMPSLGQRDILERLRDRGVPVRVVFGDTLAEVHGLIEDLGVLLDARPAARDLNASLDDAVQALRALALPPRRAAVVVGQDPLVIAGPGTFAAEILALTGLAPAFSPDAPLWPVWSVESLAATGPEILVAAEGPEAARRLLALVERALPPARRPRVLAPSRPILMRPGPSLIEDLAELGALLAAAPKAPAPVAAPVP